MHGDDEPTLRYGVDTLDQKINMSTHNKKGRGKLKARVTIDIGNLNLLLVEDDTERDTVLTSLQKLKDDYAHFEDYHRSLHSEYQGAEQKTSEEYFRTVEKSFNAICAKAQAWLDCDGDGYSEESVPDECDQGGSPDLQTITLKLDKLEEIVNRSVSHSTPEKTDKERRTTFGGVTKISGPGDVGSEAILALAGSIDSMVRNNNERIDKTLSMTQYGSARVKIPKFKLFTFGGEPIDYWPFIKSFQQQVADKVEDAGTKLAILADHMTGPPRELIKCSTMSDTPEESLNKALKLLEDEYGKFEDVSQAWLDKFYGLDPVRTVKDLEKLRTLLNNCFETLRSVRQLGEFQTRTNLALVVSKLPFRIRERWQQWSVEISEDKQRRVELADLVRFVTRVYREKSDPVFGSELDKFAEKRHGLKTQKSSMGKGYTAATVQANPEMDLAEDAPEESRVPSRKTSKINVNPVHGEGVDSVAGASSHSLAVDRLAVSSDVVGSTKEKGQVALPIVPVVAYGPGGSKVIYALLDSGSTATLCTQSLVDKLRLKGRMVTTEITTVECRDVQINSLRVAFSVSSLEGGQRYQLEDVITRPTLNLSPSSRAFNCDVKKWDHLRGIALPDVKVDEVELLIGNNYPGLLFSIEGIDSPDPLAPVANRTLLGWHVSGPLKPRKQQEERVNLTVMNIRCCETTRLEEKVDRFWSVDKVPGSEDRDGDMSVVDKKVIKMWDEKTTHDGVRYTVPIPFKDPDAPLENNRPLAERHLISLTKQLLKDPEVCDQFIDAVRKGLVNRYSEKVPENELKNPGKILYLPHHFVRHPRKPGKVRQVHNAGAKWKGVSLNDLVHAGPDLLNRLLDVLLRFREKRAGILGDIEGMFSQILIPVSQRDATRWLFYELDDIGGKVVEYRMRTHLFGGVWSPAVANYTLKRTVKDFGQEYDEAVRKFIDENFYVDDGMEAVEDVEHAVRMMNQAKELLSKGGFNFTKLMSNLEEVVRDMPPEDLSEIAKRMLLEGEEELRDCLLGCLWMPKDDVFTYEASLQKNSSSKRGVLSDMASVYDPMGMIIPIVMAAKIIFQECCRRGLSWDETLPADLQQKWNGWKRDVEMLPKLKYDRCFLPGQVSKKDVLEFFLHGFSDASEQAYGAASYVRAVHCGSTAKVTLLLAKGKLAPLKRKTIPRLELMGAQLAVQLDVYLRKTLRITITASFFHTDSTIVLCCIINIYRRFQTFFANRLGYIHEHTVPEQWHHVPTKLNPADLLSRGTSVEELERSLLWKHGPMYLLRPMDTWPAIPKSTGQRLSECELKKEADEVCAVHEGPPEKRRKFAHDSDRIEKFLNHYSTWYRLCRAVVYIHKLYRWKYRGEKVELNTTADQIKIAEWVVLRLVQARLRRDPDDHVKRQYLKLFPVMSAGLIRVGGRLARAALDPEAKHPVVMPEGQPARALVWQTHVELAHAGPQRILQQLNSRFWLINGGKVINEVIGKCVICRKAHRGTLQPLMKELPEIRVKGDQPPFTNSGVDYFGPILVKERRLRKKRYGCLFTCMVTRAIHLELACSLDVDSFMLAFTRFASRRGVPERLQSDNGSNFVGSKGVMESAMVTWEEGNLVERLAKKRCQWTMNTPLASHHGGAWERQIRSVRVILMNLGNEQVMTEETLGTFLCVAEDVINGRPITPVSKDHTDLEALTPNHLLRPDTRANLPFVLTDESDRYRRQWRVVQHLANVFWYRWKREYLPQLQVRQKWYKPRRSVMVGDLVILKEEKMPRSYWPMARVDEVYPDAEGIVRTAKVRTAKGCYVRPVQKMCLLEGVK